MRLATQLRWLLCNRSIETDHVGLECPHSVERSLAREQAPIGTTVLTVALKRRTLVEGNLRVSDHLGPFFCFSLEQYSKFIRRLAGCNHADVLKFCLGSGVVQGADRIDVDLLDNRQRRLDRNEECKPRRHV